MAGPGKDIGNAEVSKVYSIEGRYVPRRRLELRDRFVPRKPGCPDWIEVFHALPCVVRYKIKVLRRQRKKDLKNGSTDLSWMDVSMLICVTVLGAG